MLAAAMAVNVLHIDGISVPENEAALAWARQVIDSVIDPRETPPPTTGRA